MALTSNIKDGDWASVRQAIARLSSSKLGPGSSPTFAGLTLVGELDMGDNPITDVGYIDFNLVNGIAQAEGRLVWNNDEGTLNLGLKGGVVNLQVGQEMVVRGKNASGAQADNGTPMRISGATGSQPEFNLADADDPAAAGSIGLATEDIGNNSFGYVTTSGLVRDVDTSGTPVSETWNVSDRLYVSNTVGKLTNVSPTADERKIFIGVVIRAHATEGVIWVSSINVSYPHELSGVNPAALADNVILQYDSGTSTWPLTSSPTFTGLDLTGTLDMNDNRVDNLSDLNFTSATELTISSGAVTITKGHHSIDTEADAANDDLDTISGGEGGDILLLLPTHDDRSVRIRDHVGNIFLKHQTDSSPFSFSSPSGAGAATRYSGGGWYDFATTDANLTQVGTTQMFGTANVSYAAHASLVASGAGTATGGSGAVTIVVSGTSVDDQANRQAADSEVIVSDITAMSTDEYFETVKKWIGQITYTLTVGATGHTAYAADFNYGLSKYEDFANQDFTVTGIQIAGEAGASDSNFNLILFLHSSAGWTYAASGFVPGGTQLANMNTDHITEVNLVNGEPFAWKRTDLNTAILGTASEGVVVRIDTSSAKAVESMSGIIWVHTAPAFSYLADTKQHLIFMKHGPNWLEL